MRIVTYRNEGKWFAAGMLGAAPSKRYEGATEGRMASTRGGGGGGGGAGAGRMVATAGKNTMEGYNRNVTTRTPEMNQAKYRVMQQSSTTTEAENVQ